MAEKIIARGEQTIANVNDGKVKDAVGIKLVTIMYAVNTSSTVAPTSGWSTDFPGATAGRYLWTRTTTDYTDGTSGTAYSVAYSGEDGTSGNGIKETSIGYAIGDSATVPPATGWGPAIPSNPNNKYLWTDTQTTYDNGNVTHAYAVTKSGTGIQSITDHYALSASATTTPTEWSEAVPELKQGWYLWTKTTTTFDDKSISDKYSVVYIGKDGQTGNGIKGTTIDYALATQGTTSPTAGWQTSIPTVTKGAYLWTRVTTTYTSTDKKDYTYTVAYQGGDGVGIASIVYTYAVSATASSKPADSSFSSVMPTDIKGKYLWTLVTTTFTDGKSTKNYTVSYSGTDGNNADETNVINSPTPPKKPMEGTWWNDTSQTPPVLKYYQNSSWVIYQLSAINIAAGTITGDKIAGNTVTATNLKAGSVTADKLSVNAVKAANIDMSEVTYQIADSSKNLVKNSALSDAAGLVNSSGWTLPSSVTLVKNALGDNNGILIPAGTTATLVNTLWDATDSISNYVLGLWLKSAGTVSVTVNGVTSVIGGTYPITTPGDGVWNKREIKYASTAAANQLSLTVKATKDTYLARVMLSRRDTKLDGMWIPAPEDGMLNTAKLNEQVTQNFSLGNGQLKSLISNLNSGYSSNFTQNSDGTINQITRGNDLVTAINASPAGVYIKGNRIILDGTVNVTQDFYAKGGNFKNLNADNFTGGKVKADYIDVAAVVTQGLNTTNATIAKTLTMGNDGLITANLQSQTLNYTDLNPITGGVTNYPYTSTGTYKLDKTGFTISSKATFAGNRPTVNVGGRAFGIKTYEPKLYMNDASITLSSSNATGQETSQTIDGTSIPSTTVSITPYVISMSGGGQYTRLFTNGISTSGMMSAETLYLSSANIKYLITMSKGNITMPGMASDGSRTKSLRTAHRQWSGWFGQKWDLFREGDVVYATVMAGATQDIPSHTTSDEALPSGYIPKWQDATVLISDVIGRDVGVIFRTGTGKMVNIGSNSAPWTNRWSAVWFTGDPFPFGDIVQ